jgi:hypothetical protein
MNLAATSKNGIVIRLSEERWQHVVEAHPELIDRQLDVLEAVSNPEFIFEGDNGQLLAMREVKVGKWLVAVYVELNEDGFILTAFFTRRRQYLTKRRQLWP